MIKIITVHEKNATDFLDNNGIGVLTDFFSSPKVRETLNGELYLEVEYKNNGKYSQYLVEENIIVSPIGYGERQAFRIYKSRKVIGDSGTYIYVYAKHISYDLTSNVIEDSYVQDKSGDSAISWILSHTQYKHNFKGYSDIPLTNNARYVFKNPIQAILSDVDNSFVNRWGGEIVRDNYNISMLQARGQDKGVSIRYRKNLKGITFEKDYSNIVTRAKPKGYDGIELPEKFIDSPLLENYTFPKIDELKYDDIKLKQNVNDEDGFDTLEECYEEMRKRVAAEYGAGLDKPTISATVDFVELSKTVQYKEYKSLEKLCIGDTVHIYIDEFDLEVTEKVISTTYDPVLDKYTSFELGSPFTSYTLENKNYKKKLEQVIIPNYLDEAKKNATDLLTTALGGYVKKTRNELFVLDNEDINKAEHVWRWNLNGLGYSKNGVNGPYGLAMTMDGEIVADYITTGTLRSLQIINGENFSVDQSGNLVARAGTIANLKMSTSDYGSYLAKNYTNSNKTYQSGLYIPTNGTGGEVFLYAGVDVTSGNSYLTDAAAWIKHNGDAFFKHLSVDGETGYFYINYSSGRKALQLNQEGLYWYLDNGGNNRFARFIQGPTAMFLELQDALGFMLYDSLHSKVIMSVDKYNPDAPDSYINKRTNAVSFFADTYIGGYDMGGVAHKLNVIGDVFSNGVLVQTNTSDKKFKKNIKDSKSNALDIINKIRIRSFDWKNDISLSCRGSHVNNGFVAQEVKKIDDSMVIYNEKSNIYQIHLLNVVATEMKALQEEDLKVEFAYKMIFYLAEKLNCKEEILKILEVQNGKRN